VICLLPPLCTSGGLHVKDQHITIYVLIIAADGIYPKPKEGPRPVGWFFLWQLMTARAALLTGATVDVWHKHLHQKKKKKKKEKKRQDAWVSSVLFIWQKFHVRFYSTVCLNSLERSWVKEADWQSSNRFNISMEKKKKKKQHHMYWFLVHK